jgi:hypothetical protein
MILIPLMVRQDGRAEWAYESGKDLLKKQIGFAGSETREAQLPCKYFIIL